MRSASPAPLPQLSAEIVFVGFDPFAPGALSWPAHAALAAADAVLYDRDLPPATLALLPGRAFAEPVAGAEGAAARAARLSRDGWRVVRLVAADPATAAGVQAEQDRLTDVGISVRVLSGAGAAAPGLHPPRPNAAALNGLAG